MEQSSRRRLRPRPLAPAVLVGLAFSLPAAADRIVDLGTWTAESYASLAGSEDGLWTVAADGLSVVQSVNGQPTVFYSDFELVAQIVEVRVRVDVAAGDDDLIGFALGFRPGDASSQSAEYLLVDWKQVEQTHDFAAPSDTPGSTSERGLVASRVFGVPTADELWGRVNFDHPSSGLLDGLEVLGRGTGDGWEHGREYLFRFELSDASADIYLDGDLQMALAGDFSGLLDGRLAFYNFSQGGVIYRSVTLDPCAILARQSRPPADVGVALRATGHGEGPAPEVSVSFTWDGDESAPRPAREHYHVRAGDNPWFLVLVEELDVTETSWTETRPAGRWEPSVRYYEVLAADECEQLSWY